MTTKAVIYTRFSPRRQKEHESESCETQEQICKAFCDGKGYEVIGVFKDKNISGGEHNRPVLWDAIGAMKKGHVLVVFKRDRLARDILLSEQINRTMKSKGCRIEAVSGDIEGDGPQHEMARQVLDSVSQFIRACNAAQTSAHMRQHQAQGKRVGRYAPYGWTIDPDDRSRIVPSRREQEVIQYIKDLAGTGTSSYKIAQRLNATFKERARGSKWHPKTVDKILGRE